MHRSRTRRLLPVCVSHPLLLLTQTTLMGWRDLADGHAPYIRLPSGTSSTSIIFQTEYFSDPPAKPETDEHVREYRCVVTTGSQVGDGFELVYDAKRMYSGGVNVRVEGEGVECEDDGKGVARVKTTASGKDATVVITPK